MSAYAALRQRNRWLSSCASRPASTRTRSLIGAAGAHRVPHHVAAGPHRRQPTPANPRNHPLQIPLHHPVQLNPLTVCEAHRALGLRAQFVVNEPLLRRNPAAGHLRANHENPRLLLLLLRPAPPAGPGRPADRSRETSSTRSPLPRHASTPASPSTSAIWPRRPPDPSLISSTLALDIRKRCEKAAPAVAADYRSPDLPDIITQILRPCKEIPNCLWE